jgi:hypothetical protein
MPLPALPSLPPGTLFGTSGGGRIVAAGDDSNSALHELAEIPRCGWDLNPRMSVLQTDA